MPLPKKLFAPVRHMLLAVCAIAMAFPFYWLVMSALKTNDEIWQFPPALWPETPLWGNFADAWQAAESAGDWTLERVTALAPGRPVVVDEGPPLEVALRDGTRLEVGPPAVLALREHGPALGLRLELGRLRVRAGGRPFPIETAFGALELDPASVARVEVQLADGGVELPPDVG